MGRSSLPAGLPYKTYFPPPPAIPLCYPECFPLAQFLWLFSSNSTFHILFGGPAFLRWPPTLFFFVIVFFVSSCLFFKFPFLILCHFHSVPRSLGFFVSWIIFLFVVVCFSFCLDAGFSLNVLLLVLILFKRSRVLFLKVVFFSYLPSFLPSLWVLRFSCFWMIQFPQFTTCVPLLLPFFSLFISDLFLTVWGSGQPCWRF